MANPFEGPPSQPESPKIFPCPQCGGSGKDSKGESCKKCNGTGKVKDQ